MARPEKTERNKRIVKLIKNGVSFGEVAKMLGLKSRGTVWDIWQRAKEKELSTGKSLTRCTGLIK